MRRTGKFTMSEADIENKMVVEKNGESLSAGGA
jgi:hypothetical protein